MPGYRRLRGLLAALLLLCLAGCGSDADTPAPITGADAEKATQEYHQQVDQQEQGEQVP